jgi:hypothetical protein
MLNPVIRKYLSRVILLGVLGYSAYSSIRLAASSSNGIGRDPENPDSMMQAGQREEFAGDLGAAERDLLRAAQISRLYQPRYLLAQFYFRHPSGDRYWNWSRAALDTAPGDVGVIFNLSWNTHPDALWLWQNAIPHRAEIARQYLAFLTSMQEWTGSLTIARDLASRAIPSDRDTLLAWCDARLESGGSADSREIWDAMCRRKLLPYSPGDTVTNASFSQTPLATAFDWRPARVPGVTVSTTSGRLRITFTGRQPEQCLLIWQYVPPSPRPYRIDQQPRTDGIEWTLEPPLPPRDAPRLVLSYHRPVGMPRLEGAIDIAPPQLVTAP